MYLADCLPHREANTQKSATSCNLVWWCTIPNFFRQSVTQVNCSHQQKQAVKEYWEWWYHMAIVWKACRNYSFLQENWYVNEMPNWYVNVNEMPQLNNCFLEYDNNTHHTLSNYQQSFPLLRTCVSVNSWWRHQMIFFSLLLAFCAGNSPVTGEFPAKRPVTRSFDVFFHQRLNRQLSKQWRRWWFETLPRSLWRHCNAVISG